MSTNARIRTSPAGGNPPSAGLNLEKIGAIILRYGLAVVLLWVGALKFTAYEAENIEPLVSHSPLMAWAPHLFGLQTLSNIIGSIELTLGVLICTRRFAPFISGLGSLGAMVMFLITLTFSLTTPGVWQPGYGFPFPSALPGQFLAKDLLYLGAAVWSAGEAFCAYWNFSAMPDRKRMAN